MPRKTLHERQSEARERQQAFNEEVYFILQIDIIMYECKVKLQYITFLLNYENVRIQLNLCIFRRIRSVGLSVFCNVYSYTKMLEADECVRQ